jgi:hypothetical protein
LRKALHRLIPIVLGVVLSCGPLAPAWSADGLPEPTGEVILTVSGKISRTNGDGIAAFDREMIEGLGLRTLQTSTTWTEGVKMFEGVLVRDLLAYVGASGSHVTATALNDYAMGIPVSDFQKFDVLLAMRMDGRELLARDKGPLWIVYPRDSVEELRDSRYDHRWVWQLTAFEVE